MGRVRMATREVFLMASSGDAKEGKVLGGRARRGERGKREGVKRGTMGKGKGRSGKSGEGAMGKGLRRIGREGKGWVVGMRF